MKLFPASAAHAQGATAAIAVPASAASAQDNQNFGQIASGLTSQIGEFGALVGVIAAVIGLAMLVISGVKFRAYSTNPQDPSASVSGAVGWLLAGVALAALPETLGVGVTSLFGDGAEVGNLSGKVLSDN